MKKILTLLLIITLMGVNFCYAEDEIQPVTPPKEESFGLVSAVSEAEKFIPYSYAEPVTRAAFTAAAVSAFNCNMGIVGDAVYTDVSLTDDVYPYINTALGYKFISDGGEFRPNDAISLYEALKICIVAAGAGDKAEAMCGYPDGYVKAAQELGILKGVKADETGINAKNAYELLYNTLMAEADYILRNENGESISISKLETGDILAALVSKDKTLIEASVCTKSVSGTVISMNEEENTVVIDDKTYKMTDELVREKIVNVGETVTLYLGIFGEAVKAGDTNSTLLYGFMSKAKQEDGLSGKLGFRIFTKNGEERRMISGWKNGSFVEYFVENDVVFNKNGVEKPLHSGDIIRVTRNGDTIKKLIVDFDAETLAKNTGTDAPFNGKSSILQYQAGKVYSAKNGYVYLSDTKISETEYSFKTENLINVRLPGVVAVCNLKTGTIRPGNAGMIRTYKEAAEDASYIVVVITRRILYLPEA